MKRIIKVLIFAMAAVGTVGCKKNSIFTPTSDPAVAVLGKWELIALSHYRGNDSNGNTFSEEERFTPTGYIEYLSDSTMGWFDYKTKNYEILKGKYWFDVTPYYDDTCNINNSWILNYELILNNDEVRYEYYPDKQQFCNIFSCRFSGNKMNLYGIEVIPFYPFPTYIYNRIK